MVYSHPTLLLMLLSVAAPAYAQPTAIRPHPQASIVSVTYASGPYARELLSAPSSLDQASRLSQPDSVEPTSYFVPATLGSAVGVVAGLAAAWRGGAQNLYGSEQLLHFIFSGAGGATLGASLGTTLVGSNFSDALVGALVGLVPAIAAGSVTFYIVGDEALPPIVVAFSIVHGIGTALFLR